MFMYAVKGRVKRKPIFLNSRRGCQYYANEYSVDHGEILTAGLSDACDTKGEAYFNIPMTI